MTDRQLNCEDRIDAELKHELEQVERALRISLDRFLVECLDCGLTWESEDEFEECSACGSANTSSESLDPVDDEYDLLCPPYVEHVVVRADRSWGGPQDFWRLYLDPENGDILRASYYYLDWNDGAMRRLDDKQLALVAELFQEQVRYLVEER